MNDTEKFKIIQEEWTAEQDQSGSAKAMTAPSAPVAEEDPVVEIDLEWPQEFYQKISLKAQGLPLRTSL
ncbi:MAG: hypothetical protein HQL15_10065, partial [Candidatus Omnitrophica bacterium]|nr:hypothetical protein [Candidatus Omnitrophota bacterium]